MSKTSGADGAAFDADVVAGEDERSDAERAAGERALAEDLVDRLTTKRDKIAAQLADAEQALADAQAQRDGGE